MKLTFAGWAGVIVFVMASVAEALPPLTSSQQTQLAAAQDGGGALDEGPLYPLLANAASWPRGRQAGARVPDYQAIRTHPARFRGNLFLIEGEFGQSTQVDLARSGSWGRSVTRWDLRVRRNPDQVAVVFIVHPTHKLPSPRRGQRVRLVGRFYKVWGGRDMRNQPTAYPVFVGRWVKITQSKAGEARSDAEEPSILWAILPVLIVLSGAVYILRRMARTPPPRARAQPTARSADRRRSTLDLPDRKEEEEESLPQDPAAAMAELQRRHEES